MEAMKGFAVFVVIVLLIACAVCGGLGEKDDSVGLYWFSGFFAALALGLISHLARGF